MTQGKPRLTKVTINGIDVKATENTLLNWDINPTLGTTIKSVQITLHRNIYSHIPELETSPTGLSVVVQRGVLSSTEDFIFRGTILTRETLGSKIVLTCKDKLYQTVQKNITKTFNKNTDTEAGVISEIFTTIGELSNLTLDSSSVQDSGNVIILDTFICNNADAFERQQRLAEFLDWQFYYNPTTDKEHFEPKGSRAGTEVLTVGSNVVNRPKWTRDGTKIVLKSKLFGGPVDSQQTETFTATASQKDFNLGNIPVSVRVTVNSVEKIGGVENQSPDADYFVDAVNKIIRFDVALTGGESVVVEYSYLSPLTIEAVNPVTSGLEIRIDKPDIVKVEDAINYSDTFMLRHSRDFLSTILNVTNVTNLEVGQSVTVVDNDEGINETFLITRIRKRFPYAFDEVEVNTEALQIEEWSESIEDRIKRIEENLSQEETLVIHVRSGNRTIKIGRKYFKIEKRDISGTTLIWGNPTYGTWGTQKWGDTKPGTNILSFMSQGGNVYLEDFLSEDFKDSNTTSSWDTDGTLDFTAGQIAESTSIDFNNGTVTQAKLSYTGTGTFLAEMTSDGTNWETVTNNVTHIFSDTGTDLRWRITENGASVGTITDVQINNYKV